MISGLLILTISAQEIEWTEKLDNALRERITVSDGEKTIGVSIRFVDIDPEAIDARLVAATGYTRSELDEFNSDRNKRKEMLEYINRGREIIRDMYSEYNAAVLQELGIDDIRTSSTDSAFAVVAVQCKKVPEIAQSDKVLNMYDRPLVPDMPKPPEGREFIYADRFAEYYGSNYMSIGSEEIYCYNELYYHKDKNGETDWILLYALGTVNGPTVYCTGIGNRIIIKDGWNYPFSTGFGIYDVRIDRFLDVNSAASESGFDSSDYPDFVKVFDEYGVKMNSLLLTDRLIGDVDHDDELTIVDATMIQRCEAMIMEYPATDLIDTSGCTVLIDPPVYYSDFNLDGDRDILDATCIQRYLVGLFDPSFK